MFNRCFQKAGANGLLRKISHSKIGKIDRLQKTNFINISNTPQQRETHVNSNEVIHPLFDTSEFAYVNLSWFQIRDDSQIKQTQNDSSMAQVTYWADIDIRLTIMYFDICHTQVEIEKVLWLNFNRFHNISFYVANSLYMDEVEYFYAFYSFTLTYRFLFPPN